MKYIRTLADIFWETRITYRWFYTPTRLVSYPLSLGVFRSMGIQPEPRSSLPSLSNESNGYCWPSLGLAAGAETLEGLESTKICSCRRCLMIQTATVDHLWGSEFQPELRLCSSHSNSGESLEQSTILGEGGATRPSMKKSSPTLSGGQKLRP